MVFIYVKGSAMLVLCDLPEFMFWGGHMHIWESEKKKDDLSLQKDAHSQIHVAFYVRFLDVLRALLANSGPRF